MPNFYLLYGTDKSVIDNEKNNIIKKLNINDIIKYEASEDNTKDIIEDASTISMFSNKKIIIINDCYFFKTGKSLKDISLLEQYLEKYNKDTYIIFISNSEKIDSRKKIYKLIKNNGQIKECNKQDKNYLTDYVQKYIKENKYKIEDIDYFLKIVGSNLNNITNELDKLFMYKIDNKTITKDDIDKITIKNMENEIFDLTDAVIKGDVPLSLELLDNFVKKDYDEIQIMVLLANQFRFLFQVKRLLNKNKTYNEIAKILEVNPYRVKFTINKLYSYSEQTLLDNISRLAKLDHDIKLGLINKRLGLELFIINRK